MQQEETPDVRLTTMQALVGEHPGTILDDCLAYTAYAENNYFPFLWRFYKSRRQTLFGLLDHLRLSSTSQRCGGRSGGGLPPNASDQHARLAHSNRRSIWRGCLTSGGSW